MLVDKIVPHRYVPVPARFVDPTSGASENGLRVVDLPDTGGYILLAVGVVCLMYFVALGGKKGNA